MPAQKIKLNSSSLKKLEPREKQFIVRDSELPGLGVLVSPGGRKTWIFEQKFKGRSKRITIGAGIPEAQARKEAKKMIGLMAQGIDPVESKSNQDRESLTLSQAVEDYLARPNMKDSTRKDVQRAMNHFSAWMKKPIKSITPAMVEKRHRELTAQARSSGARANLTMRYLRAVINHCSTVNANADGTPFILHNPVKRLSATKQWNRIKRRRSLISPDAMPQWFEVVQNGLTGLRNDNELRDALLLSVLTGVRPSEALNLKWSNVDFERKTLTFIDTKNHSDHELPLTRWLGSVLTARREINSGSEFVFTSATGNTLKTLRSAQERIQKVTGLVFKPSDCRRTFTSTATRLDVGTYTLKRMLNHTVESNDVTAGYVVVSTDDLRPIMQRIEDQILTDAGLIEGKVIQGHFRSQAV